MSDKYDRLAEIKERLKTNYYWDRLEVPSLLVDEDMEWLIEVVERRRAELKQLRAVAEAAQGVINCLDLKADDHVWDHASGGACLNLLDEALSALNSYQI